jgi:hypothetical protein
MENCMGVDEAAHSFTNNVDSRQIPLAHIVGVPTLLGEEDSFLHGLIYDESCVSAEDFATCSLILSLYISAPYGSQ